MGDSSRFIKNMQRLSAPKSNMVDDLVIGEVTSVNPLKIKVGNDLEYTEAFLILSPFVQQWNVPQHTTQAASVSEHGSHSHTVSSFMAWRGLRVADKVIMLKTGRGQKFYVLHRLEGIV